MFCTVRSSTLSHYYEHFIVYLFFFVVTVTSANTLYYFLHTPLAVIEDKVYKLLYIIKCIYMRCKIQVHELIILDNENTCM